MSGYLEGDRRRRGDRLDLERDRDLRLRRRSGLREGVLRRLLMGSKWGRAQQTKAIAALELDFGVGSPGWMQPTKVYARKVHPRGPPPPWFGM